MLQNTKRKAFGLFCLWVYSAISCNSFLLSGQPIPTLPAATLYATDTPIAPPTFFPTDTPLPPPTPIETGQPVVSLVLYPVESRDAYTGREMEVVLEAIPTRLTITHKSDGSVESVSTTWTDFTVSEMQICFSFDAPCQLSEPWAPFILSPDSNYLGGSARQKYSFFIDWIGPRIMWAVAQFRDGQGQSIPSFSTTFSSNQPVVVSQISMQIVGIWNEATPAQDQPAPVQTAIAATKTAYPVTGSVVLAGGSSAAGGVAGELIQIQAAFAAASPEVQCLKCE